MWISLSAALLLSLSSAFAQSSEDAKTWAQAIISQRLAMKPKTDFDKWVADQWSHSASLCAYHAKMPDPKEIAKLGNYKAGSFSFPDESEDFCKALAQGPSPQCFSFRATVEPFEFPPKGMTTDYLYMKKVVPENTPAMLLGVCHLVTSKPVTKQHYTGMAKIKWLQQPSMKTVNTFSGPKELNMGTLTFEIDGIPEGTYVPPMSVVILP